MTASIGKVISLVEADYCYGQGTLAIRVERVDQAHPVRYDGDTWYRVEGVQLSRSGVEIGRREVLVRARRLPR